jgi:hypothetical protein
MSTTFYSSGRTGTRNDEVYNSNLGGRNVTIPFTEVFPPTYQVSMSAYFVSESTVTSPEATVLNNNNVMIFYSDGLATSDLAGTVYSQVGEQVIAGSILSTTGEYGSGSAITFNDGNVLIERVGDQILTWPYANVYDNVFTELSESLLQVPDMVNMHRSNAILLSNGSAFVIHQWAVFSGGTKHIRNSILGDSSGSIVTQSMWALDEVYDAQSAQQQFSRDLTQMSNDNIMVIYRDENDSGSLQVFDISGSNVSGKVTYMNAANSKNKLNDYASLVGLADGNVFIAYVDSNDGNYLKYQIVDNTGSAVVSETTIDSVSTEFIRVILDANNDVFISYADKTNDKGSFIIYNTSGSLIQGKTTFSDVGVNVSSPVLLNNNNIFVAYMETITRSGSFVILEKQ